MSKQAVFILLLLAVLVSCGGEPVAPISGGGSTFNWMNNPDNGNLRITRFEDGFIACWSDGVSDAGTGLRACHSTIPLGGGGETDCGPQKNLDPIQYQGVGLLDELDIVSSWIRQNAKGVLWITVRDLSQPGTCFDNKLVAEGWGNFHNNDNDVFGALPDDNNSNAWRFAAQGRLTTPTGATVSYNGHLNLLFGNVQGFKELSARVAVN